MVSVTGDKAVIARLRSMAEAFPRAVAAALQAELEVESTESQRRTPVETGALRASHRVEVRRDGANIEGTISVGGPSAGYAVYVHENLEAFHPVGQAKFLESTITESAPFMARRLAARIDLRQVAR